MSKEKIKRRFIVDEKGNVTEEKLNTDEPIRKFIVDEKGNAKVEAFTEKDRKKYRMMEYLDKIKFLQENPDVREDIARQLMKDVDEEENNKKGSGKGEE